MKQFRRHPLIHLKWGGGLNIMLKGCEQLYKKYGESEYSVWKRPPSSPNNKKWKLIFHSVMNTCIVKFYTIFSLRQATAIVRGKSQLSFKPIKWNSW